MISTCHQEAAKQEAFKKSITLGEIRRKRERWLNINYVYDVSQESKQRTGCSQTIVYHLDNLTSLYVDYSYTLNWALHMITIVPLAPVCKARK